MGLTIKPGTAPEALAPYLDQLDLVLVMSVEPGFGGQKFMPSAMEKLRWLKEERAKRSARYLLEVDGGVDDTTAPLCVERVPIFWWRAVPCSAQPTRLRQCAVWPLCERCLTMDERLIQQQEQELAKTGRYYLHVCFMTIPLLCMACFLYGLRPLLLCGAALLTGNLCDRLVSLLRRRVYRAGDFSNESFALSSPCSCPPRWTGMWSLWRCWPVSLSARRCLAATAAIPSTPLLWATPWRRCPGRSRCSATPSLYQHPSVGSTGVPVSSTISDTLRSGGSLNISAISLGLGEYAAPMGTGAALILLACGLFLWLQKDVRLGASVSFVVTCALIAFLFPRQVGVNGVDIALRLQCVRDELLTGAMLFSAVFLLNEPYTCAHHHLGRILYGVLVGAITMGFRYYGVYETGVCFALLTVNSISGWMDRTESRLYQLMHRPAAGKEGAE